jgi:hypothetical protein
MSGSFSIAIWVNQVFDSFQGNNARIVGQGDWMNLFSPSSGMSFVRLDGINPDAAGPAASAADLPSQDVWTFYVGVVERDGPGQSTVRLYRDDGLVQEITHGSELLNPGTCRFYIGGFPSSDTCTGTQQDQFDAIPAYVDDLRVYSRVLESWEVNALFHEGDYFP